MAKTNEIPKIALLKETLKSTEASLKTAQDLVKELAGDKDFAKQVKERLKKLPKTETEIVTEGQKAIEGVFDGENMVGDDGKKYPVPANYASKSKLVEGDLLKLTIADNGSFIYKQIGPVARKMVRGILTEENGEYHIMGEGKDYRVILASVTYYRAKPGDEVTIVIPEAGDSVWAAIENVIYKPE